MTNHVICRMCQFLQKRFLKHIVTLKHTRILEKKSFKIVIDTAEMHQVEGEVAFRYISTIAVFDCWRKSMLSSSSGLQWLTLLDIIGLSQVWHWPW